MEYLTNRWTKFIIAIFSLFIILSTIGAYAADNDGRVDSIYKEPQIFIKNEDLPEVMVGEVFNLDLTLDNESIYTARDVYITPQLDGTPFESVELLNRIKLNRVLAGKETDVAFKFKVDEQIEPGVYPLTFEFNYQNMYRDEFPTRTRTIYIEVIEAPDLPELKVNSVLSTPESIKAGKEADVSFEVQNFGEKIAKDIEFKLTNLSENSFSITNDVNFRKAEQLEGGEKTSFDYKLSANEDMLTGGHKLEYLLKYKDEYGRVHEETGEIFLSVLAKDDEGEEEEDESTTVPKIIVSSYGTSPSIVRAGSNFTLNIRFQNTSKIRTVRNIKISLTAPEGSSDTGNVFTPVNSSNTIFIDEISPKGIVTKNMPFYAVMDAQPRTYTVQASFEYEDTKGNQYSSSEEIGIRVIQQPRLEVSEPQIPQEIMQGGSASLFTEFYNMGRTTIYNLMVKVEGDFELRNPNYFVGNFDSGSRDYLDTSLTATAPGTAEGRIIYQFEDAAGETQEIAQEFTIEVMEASNEPMNPDQGEYPEEPGKYPGPDGPGAIEESTPFWKSPIAWGILIAIIALIIIFRKVRKSKREKQIEQDLLKDIEIDE
ncbi:MAG: COG1361 S-layer family protein [Clostridia bacterium]